jgi:hypothetical protein
LEYNNVVILRIIGFLVFAHPLGFYKLINTTFQKLDLFPPSGEGQEDTHSVGSLRKS